MSDPQVFMPHLQKTYDMLLSGLSEVEGWDRLKALSSVGEALKWPEKIKELEAENEALKDWQGKADSLAKLVEEQRELVAALNERMNSIESNRKCQNRKCQKCRGTGQEHTQVSGYFDCRACGGKGF